MSESEQPRRSQARDVYWSDNDRANYICPDCGRSAAQIRGEFEVHHKDGNPHNNESENLVGLCSFCHNLREDKKPSLNDIRQFRDSEALRGRSGRTVYQMSSSDDAKDELFRENESENEVTLLIEEFADGYNVHIDWLTTAGWIATKRDDVSISHESARLTNSALDTASRILDKYTSSVKNQSQLSTAASFYGIGFDELTKAVQFISEIEYVVRDKDNWRPTDRALHLICSNDVPLSSLAVNTPGLESPQTDWFVQWGGWS